MQLEVLSRRPAGSSRGPPLLFVHGAWHAAWCWDEHFLPYFIDHGYETHALSLRGHGRSEGKWRWARLAQYVNDVDGVASELPEMPILIGHSMGGLVVQKLLERRRAPAAVLVAPDPLRGAWGATWRVLRGQPAAFLKANATWNLYPIVGTPELARWALLSDELDDGEVDRMWRALGPESYFAYVGMLLQWPRPKRVHNPVLVIGGDSDRIFSVSEFQATAEAYGTEPVIVPGAAHDLMLDPLWESAASAIRAWLEAMPDAAAT